MNKKYTPDQIIADLKELIATVDDMRRSTTPESEQAFAFARKLNNVIDKNLNLHMQMFIATQCKRRCVENNYGDFDA